MVERRYLLPVVVVEVVSVPVVVVDVVSVPVVVVDSVDVEARGSLVNDMRPQLHSWT